MNKSKLDLTDKIRSYLVEKNKNILFTELSGQFLELAGLKDILTGVDVPVTPEAVSHLTNLTIAMGMARVIGADEDFRYGDAYRECLRRIYGDNCSKVLISEGAKAGGSGDFAMACIFFRAALQMDPDSQDALYLYGRACLDAYSQEDQEEEYVGYFKAQSIDIFEELTIQHPDFDMGYYFLGYSYANLGQYTKAQLTWQEFMKLSRNHREASGSTMNPVPDDEIQDMREEIGDRLESMEEAVNIEHAVNRIRTGDYQNGVEMLSEYTSGQYQDWWPMWYYLGIAYVGLDNEAEAVESYKHALRLSPSNIQVMTELVDVYQALGDHVNAEKYINKIKVVQQSLEQETNNQL